MLSAVSERLCSAGIVTDSNDQRKADPKSLADQHPGDWFSEQFLSGFWAAAMSSLTG